MEQINIEKIMEEIREEAKKRAIEEPSLQFKDLPIEQSMGDGEILEKMDQEDLLDTIRKVNQTREVSLGQEYIGGGPKGAFKRSIRKMVTFLLLPILDQINRFHEYTAAAVNQIVYLSYEKKDADKGTESGSGQEVEDLKKRIHDLEEKMRVLEEKMGGEA